ncbi:MAG TPA: tRNA (adenosine(37)-N6)-threonylcarbamoyltransferase complex ATPase subunit type 1 TsaE [Saprospiraceae bacterium]|nr:tRNA (adenosine(37)-N6)-threonylcarbamoyltransferase complex ATPase subunit type 1 TsaE [Saprospiraceae bacterium]
MKTYEISKIEDYLPIIKEVLSACPRRVFLLEGDLGVGKTTFVKSICHFLGVEDMVDSPTFSIVNKYDYALAGKTESVYHLDLYRIESVEEALDFGIYEILDSGHWVFIEWPAIIEPLLDGDECKINITELANSHRKLVLL